MGLIRHFVPFLEINPGAFPPHPDWPVGLDAHVEFVGCWGWLVHFRGLNRRCRW